MPRNAETTLDARRTLLGHLDQGHTGCITAIGTGGKLLVYVMMGEVLAAHSDGDAERIVGLVENGGSLSGPMVAELRRRIAEGGAVAEMLFDTITDEQVMEYLFERFRENLFQYLTSGQVVEFAPMEAVFTDNIQVGHDSRALIEELTRVYAAVAGLLGEDQLSLSRFERAPVTPEQARIWALCEAPMRLAEILRRAPWEASRTLAQLKFMVDEGILALEIPSRAEESNDEPTEEAPRPASARGAERAAQLRREALPEVDEEMAAFQDYDTSRTGGDFVADTALLDRVEVVDAKPLPASTETLIEMEDAEHAGKDALSRAVSLNFSGPKLQDDEARKKLDVVNETLGTICDAITAAEGAGAGAARIQLIVEGMSGPLIHLFKNVEVSARGGLPSDVVIRNLRKRPPGEQRRLFNRGLQDVIERAVSMAFESLDDAAVEDMLERIAGYQQRIGV